MDQNGFPCIRSLKLQGYRPFRDFTARLSELEVIVGANGSGKSCLFEFLRFLRDAAHTEIPSEIVAGSIGQQIFHRPGPDKFQWGIQVGPLGSTVLCYEGELLGPVGRPQVSCEQVVSSGPYPTDDDEHFEFMNVRDRQGIAQNLGMHHSVVRQELHLRKPNQTALSSMTNPNMMTLYDLREYTMGWRFYSAFTVNDTEIRRSVPIGQHPMLHEDCGNLSAVLFYLMTEHPTLFDELKSHIGAAVPGFRALTVKARGGPGEVIAFWQEYGVDGELSLADLSDGILRFLCWATLCLVPNPPSLVCIDEPDQGVHPRTLPILAGLFDKASTRTQLLLATHASYFLTQFDIARIAVMKKVEGESVYLKPADSAALRANLDEFGSDELEAMHRSDELEILA